MKHTYARYRVMSMIAALFVLGLALPGDAQTGAGGLAQGVGMAEVAPVQRAVLITELQTGAQAAGDEFIELYNASSTEVAIGGWHLRYLNVGSTGATTLVATITEGTKLPAHTHYVLHTDSVPLPADILGQEFAPTLSNKDKVIGLYAPDLANCRLDAHDAIAWGASTLGEGRAVPAQDADMPKYLYRYRTAAGVYIDTNTNSHDIGIASAVKAVPSIGLLNTSLLTAPETAWPPKGPGSVLPPVQIKECGTPPPAPPTPPAPQVPQLPPTTSPPTVVTPPEDDTPPKPRIPEANIGLLAPQISELLPNPAKPQTDADNEFIELYNPNNARFELSGFVLEVGSKAKKRFTFPEGVMLAPKSFTAFTSADTKLALSNAQGQVWLLDPLHRVIGQSDAYQNAKDGQAWLTADGAWQWTTMPTPNAINIVKKPATKKTASAAAAAKSQTASTVKGATTNAPNSPTPAADTQAESSKENSSFNPLHPGILALTGVLAVLYAVYEYRRDLANKFHQFRANRTARRSLRQKPQGRGGDRVSE